MGARPLPPELLAGLPPAVVEFIQAILAEKAALKARVAELEAKLNQNSSNSSKPPSSDPPAVKRAPDRPATGKKRGGQPGHPRHERVRLPPTRVIDHKPARCDGCQRPLAGNDPDPAWRQVWELPKVQPDVTEHRFHTLGCRACGATTTAERPAGYGPHLQAAAVYPTGSLNASKAQAAEVMAELLGVPLSTGQVCAIEQRAAGALAPAVAELHAALPGCHVNMDETGWKESGRTAWLWVAVTASFTLFPGGLLAGPGGGPGPARGGLRERADDRPVVGLHRRRATAGLLGPPAARLPGPDRSGRGGEADRRAALSLSDLVFHNWKRVRDGTLTRAVAVRRILDWYAPDIRLTLEKGTRADRPRHAPCAAICWAGGTACGRSAGWTGWSRRTTRPSGRCGGRSCGGSGARGRGRPPGRGMSDWC